MTPVDCNSDNARTVILTMLQFEFQQWQEYNFAPCGYWQTLLARLLERANRSDHQTSTAAVILHCVMQRSRYVLLDTYTFVWGEFLLPPYFTA